MRIDILTLFPEMCERVLDESVIGTARENGAVEICCHNIRDYTESKHRRVDDYPYGGGQGMLMQAEPIARCFDSLCAHLGTRPRLVYMSPRGKVFTQQTARDYAAFENLCLLCGHYEGIDQRFIDEYVDEELSIGDYVLTGGELAALVVTDAVARMLPGVLAEEASYSDESHYAGLLEYPQYTRPPVWHGISVPDVLTSGHAANIAAWKRRKAIETTSKHRPDMLLAAIEQGSLNSKECDEAKALIGTGGSAE